MKIKTIETKLYRIPPTIPWEDSIHKITGIEWIVAKVTTDTGLTGIGWSYTVGTGGTAVKALLDDYLIPIAINEDPMCIERVWQKLWNEAKGVGGGISSLAIAPIDIALWDIAAKKNNVPLYKFLGGEKNRILAYASGIDLHLSLEDLLKRINRHLEQGYNAVKIKVGKENPEEDTERVAAVRKLIGPDRLLLVDANQKWTSGEAVYRTTQLEKYNPYWMEEPLTSDDIDGHSHLRNSVKTPIAIGESLWNKYQFSEYIKRGACDIVQADVARVGGITEWMKIAHLAQAANLPMAPHFLMEISVQVLCAIPNSFILENVTGGSLSEMGVLETSIQPVDGYIYPPEDPGHGVRFKEEILKKYEITPEQMKKMDLKVKKG